MAHVHRTVWPHLPYIIFVDNLHSINCSTELRIRKADFLKRLVPIEMLD
jgi:hypothetical protein